MRKVPRIPKELLGAVSCKTCSEPLVNSSDGYWVCLNHHTGLIPEASVLEAVRTAQRRARNKAAVEGVSPETVLELARRGFVDEDSDRACVRSG